MLFLKRLKLLLLSALAALLSIITLPLTAVFKTMQMFVLIPYARLVIYITESAQNFKIELEELKQKKLEEREKKKEEEESENEETGD